MHRAVGDLAKKDGKKRLGRVDRFHERFNQAIELLVGRSGAGRDGRELLDDRREMLADDGGVEGALARKVVVDHRLVDAGAAGDAVDGGRGEAARAELVGGGGENAAAGAGRGGGVTAGHRSY